MAFDKGPSLIEVPDRTLYALMAAAGDALLDLTEYGATHEYALSTKERLEDAVRAMRAALDPRNCK